MKTTIMKVRLWGEEVGRLMWDARRGNSSFAYNPNFLKRSLNVAPIILPVDGPAALRPVWGSKGRLYQGLPPFIADSLPDNWGNKVFEQWARDNNIKRHDMSPLEKLAYIGKRGMGAFEFEPEMDRNDDGEDLHIKKLAELAEKIFRQREEESVLKDENITLQSLFRIGTSAGGRQAKAIIAINEKTGEIRSGQVTAAPEFVHYLLKFDMKFDYGHPATRLEMVYYEMATAAGVRMMPSRLLPVEGKMHFLTERYDRKGGDKIHTQSLAAMNPFADSYEEFFKTARRIDVDRTELIELYRQMVFNFLAGNTDDHNKNFGFLMDRDGKWHLSPAYDLTFTQLSPEGRSSHCLTLRGKASGATVDDLLAFAADEGIPSPGRIITEVADAVTMFRSLCTQYGVYGYWVNFIEEELHALAPASHKDRLLGWKTGAVGEYMVDGMKVSGVRIEPTVRGNIHLYAQIDGQKYKYIFRSGAEITETLLLPDEKTGSEEFLKELVEQYLMPKAHKGPDVAQNTI